MNTLTHHDYQLTLPPDLLANAVPDTLILVGQNGVIKWVNDQIEPLLGYQREDLLGKTVETLVPHPLRKAHLQMRDRYSQCPFQRPMGYTDALHAVKKNGRLTAVDVELSPLNWQEQSYTLVILRSKADQTEKDQLLTDTQKKLQRTEALSGVATWQWNLLTHENHVSSEMQKIFGVTMSDNSFSQYAQLIHPDDRARMITTIKSAISERQAFTAEARIDKPGVSEFWVRVNGKVYPGNNHAHEQLLGTVQDITEEKQQRIHMQLANTLYQHSHQGYVSTHKNLRIFSANPATTRLTGYDYEQLVGMYLRDLFNLTSAFAVRPILKALRQQNFWQGEQLCKRQNGSQFPVHMAIAQVQEDKEPYLIFTINDITAIKSHEQQLDRLAHYDPLTDLPNRTRFLSSLDQALSEATQQHRPLSILYVDLDGFKEVNDTQGHSVGDALLKKIADELRALVDKNTIVARLGGDEFALLHKPTDIRDDQKLAQRLVQKLSFRERYDDCTLAISASVGIACYPLDGSDKLELLRKADQAMYQAKNRGKNQYCYYDPIEGDRLFQRLHLITDINEAISNKNLELYFQPKLTHDKSCCQAEALLRWKHPQRGMIAPQEFIPVAEQSGQIIPLGLLTLELACQFVQQWQQRYPLPLKVALNLSARQLHDPLISDKYSAILKKYALTGNLFEFEITESVVMENFETSLKVLHQLKSLGASIAIDDFGTGYSSLSYLKRLPVDTLKIDRSFIAPLPHSNDDVSIVQAIISMAKSLGLMVVAEGVETAEQKALLLKLGCDQLQGYHICYPLPPADYLDYNKQFLL